jgi:hypothetical protein
MDQSAYPHQCLALDETPYEVYCREKKLDHDNENRTIICTTCLPMGAHVMISSCLLSLYDIVQPSKTKFLKINRKI